MIEEITLREKIKLSRLRAGISRAELSKRLNVSERTIWNYEEIPGYIEKIKKEIMQGLCRELNIDPCIFFEKEAEPCQ